MDKESVLKEFQSLPSVGKAVAEDLWLMGFRSKDQFKDKDPELLYVKLNQIKGYKTDPCMLYTFRCIVYAVTEPNPDPSLLKWPAWSDKNLAKRGIKLH